MKVKVLTMFCTNWHLVGKKEVLQALILAALIYGNCLIYTSLINIHRTQHKDGRDW